MTSPHLSERALQEAAESASLLPASQVAHLRDCPLCRDRVATYQQLLTAVAHLPQPTFSFDLTASVLAQLPRAKPTFPWVLSGVAALVLGVVVAFLALFGGLLVSAFQRLSTGLGAGLVTVAGLLVAGQCLELLARHRRQMRQLAFS
jgi:anti-sigma factor RsiW